MNTKKLPAHGIIFNLKINLKIFTKNRPKVIANYLIPATLAFYILCIHGPPQKNQSGGFIKRPVREIWKCQRKFQKQLTK